jgi:RNA polymerase sigma-32 factor
MAQPDSSMFEQACRQAAREPALSEAAERALVQRYQAGDEAAGQLLVRRHLPVVVSLARRYRGYGVPRDELISEGNVGLVRALAKFDLRGVRFKTYATYWVRAQMLAFVLRASSLVTRATGAVGAQVFFKLRGARARLETVLGPGHEAIDEQLAQQFGLTVEQVRAHSARLTSNDQSLDAAVTGDSETTLLDQLASDSGDPEALSADAELAEHVHTVVRRLRKSLDERERAVLEARLMNDEDDVTLAELAQRFSLSRERIRQLELKVKERLARALSHDHAAVA